MNLIRLKNKVKIFSKDEFLKAISDSEAQVKEVQLYKDIEVADDKNLNKDN